MSVLIVEDGTGLASANSFASASYFDDYFTKLNRTDLVDLDEEVKEAALIAGTQAVNAFRAWPGEIAVFTQALSFPRRCAYDDEGRRLEGVPTPIADATCEFAAAHIESALNVTEERGGMVRREQVDVIETEYFDGAPAGRTFPYVDFLLRHIGSGGSQPRLIRA